MRLRTNHRRLAALEDYVGKELLTGEIEQYKGKWQEMLGNTPLALEIGCGKGAFITGMAALHPEISFLGIESQKEVCYYAVKKIREQKLPNVKIIFGNAENLCAWFAPGEVAKLYLNFSDPWPKERHLKRRLTSESYIAGYQRILKPGGTIEIKTDNNMLFEFTLKVVESKKIEITELSRNLHKSELSAQRWMTEYEENFSRQGLEINYLKVRV